MNTFWCVLYALLLVAGVAVWATLGPDMPPVVKMVSPLWWVAATAMFSYHWNRRELDRL